MEKHVRYFLRSALLLFALGISGQVSAQPQVITTVPVDSENFISIGGFVYFTSGEELWRTDGTAEGTILLQEGFDQGHLWNSPAYGREFRGNFYFVNKDRELWKSDGTPSGTVSLHTSDENYMRIYGQTEDYLFFGAHENAFGVELYRTNGTAGGTILLKDINPGSANGVHVEGHAVVGNYLFFPANDGSTGQELWRSNGSPEGTVMVRDINPGAADGFPGNGTVLGHEGLFYFAGSTPDAGLEPWVSDGTADGTFLLDNVVPWSLSPRGVDFTIGNNGTVYFLAHGVDVDGAIELWRTDGTTSQTIMIENIGYDPDTFHSFRVYNNKVFFFNDGDPTDYLWVTDGTSDGTEVIFDNTAGEGYFHYFDVVNDYLLFTGDAQNFPTPFFRSDGTAAGTEPFANFKAFSMATDIVERIGVTTVGDFAFFADHDGPVESGEVPTNPADYFHLFQTDGFTTESMRTIFGVPTVGTNHITDFNGKVVFTTYDDQNGGTGDKQLWIYDPTSHTETGASFTLVNAETDEDIQTIEDGAILTLPERLKINIRFNPAAPPESVRFNLNGGNVRTEREAPYSLAGDKSGDYNIWQEQTHSATYYLTAWPYYMVDGERTLGEPVSVDFEIVREPVEDICRASGIILREYWTDVPGSRVSDIPVNTTPTRTEYLSAFEGPTNAGTNYGARISGYICPPATGEYTFWIASNDHSELWLSTDDDANNKVRIASVEGATNPHQWSKFSSQQSAPVTFTTGQRYYIEVLHKQGAGTDHVAVGWQLPDGTMERPIPGSRLSPAGDDGNTLPIVSIISPEEDQTFNSSQTIEIAVLAEDDDGGVTKVEFFSDSEKLGEDEAVSGGNTFYYQWDNATPGIHTITAKATDDVGGTRVSEPVSITVTGTECTAAGVITRDYWANVPGARVSDIPQSSPPTSTNEIDIFEGPINIGTHYASRIHGYICPPTTGNYTFWIASNDHSELWLSADEDPANKLRIAFVEGATGPRQWDRFASQRSEPVLLEEGKRYYIEALHKQGVGSDHLAVGWMLPDGVYERPVPGHYLSPFQSNETVRIASANEDAASKDALYSEISIYPNPVPAGNAELKISGYEGIGQTIETDVEIINLTGEVVYNERVRCGGDCGTYLMQIDQQLVPGVYMVNIKTNGIRFSKRLLVK